MNNPTKATPKTAPQGVELYRKDRNKFIPLGVLLEREMGGAGYFLTLDLAGHKYKMHAGSASGLWFDNIASA